MTASTINGFVYAVPQNVTVHINHWLNGSFIKLGPLCCLISTNKETWKIQQSDDHWVDKCPSGTLLFSISVIHIGTRKLSQLPPKLSYICLNIDTNLTLFTIWQQKMIFLQLLIVVHYALLIA